MDKVWIVEGDQWESSWVDSVHNSEEKAKAKMNALNSKKENSYTEYSYSEYEVE